MLCDLLFLIREETVRIADPCARRCKRAMTFPVSG